MHHIAFVGGGSGGHVTPIASLIRYGLQDNEIMHNCKLFRFGEKDGLEDRIASSFLEVTFVPIPAGKIRRYLTVSSFFANCIDIGKSFFGILKSIYLLKKNAISVLFCKGGFVAFPVSIGAFVLRIPIVLHESDTYAGLTNRIIARFAKTVFTGFPDSLPNNRPIGQILSIDLIHPDQVLYTEIAQKAQSRPVCLVIGGSQGASILFDRVNQYIQNTPNQPFFFILILGTKNTNAYETLFANETSVLCFGFIESMHQLASIYQLSDIAITRGSATTLAEQHLFGIHKIIVPLPHTGGNHQWYNGLIYRDTYHDICLKQDASMDESLRTALSGFSTYKKQQQTIDTHGLITPLQTIREALIRYCV